jgi:nuclear transport factor 2 (NTF2) superfamily protein
MANAGVTQEQALEMVKAAQRNFGSADVEAILSAFTDDVVIRFADVPEMRGKGDAELFLRARFSRQKDYRLTKTLRMVQGNMIGNYWDGEWVDAQTGRRMRGRGTEFWTLRGEKIAVWEATFNVWDAEAGPKPAVL